MFQTIVDAMQALGDGGLIFGLLNSQKGEDEFQKELGRKLEQMTEADSWRWRYSHRDKEERFKTAALKNKDTIEIDVVGRHSERGTIAIELKYVPAPPKDRAAFPWGVAKDCLKLDLLQACYCRPVDSFASLPDPNSLETYVIALTNWPHYWEGKKPLAWATSFANAMRANPVCLDGIIRTQGGNPRNTIFRQGRCHIAFGRAWKGEWRVYSSTKQTDQFRYLLLRPKIDATPQWVHHQKSISEQSEIIPFLNDASREEHHRQRERMVLPEASAPDSDNG
jgi:hypothetical protein